MLNNYILIDFYRLFASLAGDKSPMVPYSREIADQRRKYGDNMLRKGDEHLAAQRQFEAEAQGRIEAARKKRQEEKDRQEALEVELLLFTCIVLLTDCIVPLGCTHESIAG